jgi:hypothetical protein
MKLNKTEQKLVDQLHLGQTTEAVVNPYSGVRVVLTPLGVALYDYVKGCEMTGNYKNFDTARYLFAKLYPSEYMQLLD